jgi:ParB/RepB/Spo0J family partition protein
VKTEMFDIEKIQPYANNPRRNDHAVAAVAASIAEFGFRQPIVLDGHYRLVVGDTRLKAAKRLGMKQVPVHVITELTPEQARAYRIADNKTAELADWDQAARPGTNRVGEGEH